MWFYDVSADGWSLDDKRTPALDEEKLGPTPDQRLSAEEHTTNNLPDVLARWAERDRSERKRARTEQSFCVSKEELAAEGYDLSLNRYKEILHEKETHRLPAEIFADIEKLENEIRAGLGELREVVE